LLYNEKLTTQAREDAMAKLSPTKGVVNVGQLIISKGEIVNETTHNTLESLRKEYEKRVGFSGSTWLLVLGQIFIICLIMAALYFYLTLIYDKPLGFKQICFVLMLIVIFYLLVLWTVRTQVANPYVIPLAVLPIFITTFFDSKLALFIHLITVSLISIIVPNSFEFYLLSTAAGMAAIYSMKDVYRRGKLYLTAIIIFLCYSILYSAFSLIKEGSFINFNWRPYFWFAVSAGLVLAAYQLVYLFEKIFGFTSDNTLMEIADTNQALLRELAEVAPATFQHCMQVANLAESAIREIGGNPLLVRVGALYHDVGKMNNPSYFIENQLQGFSPHKELSAEESASVIIKHVPDGISIAKKHRLPEVVIDFIRTHHGLSQVRYFRNLYREQNPDATDFSKFEYPGPNPTSKEQGVLMMADAVEAASRSLTTYTTESINGLVEGVAKTLIDDKLFDNTDLTFADITTIKNTFKKKLQNIYHDRVVD
jgi:putative nucleotidyltransferase with HDIG domain